MNTPNKQKQHRHPGLWSVPSRSASGLKNFEPSEASFDYGRFAEVIELLQQVASPGLTPGRWVTLIGQPQVFEQSHKSSIQVIERLLQQAGIDKCQVRWIRPNDDDSTVWAAEQALLLDNSSVVIAWLGECSARDWQRLLLSSKRSGIKSLLYGQATRSSPFQSSLH